MTRTKRLVYLFTLIFLMACRTYGCIGSTQELTSDLRQVSCQRYFQTPNEGATRVYVCFIECPGYNGRYEIEMSTRPYFNDVTYDQLMAQACPASTAAPSAEMPATKTPTATPSPASEQTVIQPLLSGKVSACDRNKGFINFIQADPMLDITGKKVVLTLNSVEASCSIAGSNADLYSCALPAETKFPAEVIVMLDGTQINAFSYDGSNCVTAPPTRKDAPPDALPTQPTPNS